MDFKQIRTIVIQAIFSDDALTERLVLKGGNALEIALGIISRGSIDVDFSIENDFDDPAEIERRLFAALADRFEPHDLVVFDRRFERKPPPLANDPTPWWAGYRATFKLLPRKRHEALKARLAKAQIAALPIAPNQEKSFTIDISTHEFCGAKDTVDIEGFTVYLYTPAMLAIEKLRAICQQMPEYETLQNKRARARDFYDIHAIVARLGVDLAEPRNLALVPEIFGAKRVPLHLLGKIRDVREFHRIDWASVRDAVSGEVLDYDFYFDFVAAQAARLNALWNE